ncbi:MAG: Rieske (2Fe-2S) protein [Fimbriimonadaceae bacterium]|nr:Rieske (2Fe-2S) protein [Fimbriimonadaceae bacterium]
MCDPSDAETTRREILRRLSCGAVAAGGWSGVGPWELFRRVARLLQPKRICALEELPPNNSVAFAYPRAQDACLLLRTEQGELRAYSRTCTHLGCTVGWNAKSHRIECPCHGGAYDADTGEVVEGPPPDPLPRVVVEVRNGDVWAIGLREGGSLR